MQPHISRPRTVAGREDGVLAQMDELRKKMIAFTMANFRLWRRESWVRYPQAEVKDEVFQALKERARSQLEQIGEDFEADVFQAL